MDKKVLVTEIRKVVEAFKQESKTFDFVSLSSIYGTDDSFELNLKADWLLAMPRYKAIEAVVSKLYEIMDKRYLIPINGIHIIENHENLQEISYLIIEKPTNYPLAA